MGGHSKKTTVPTRMPEPEELKAFRAGLYDQFTPMIGGINSDYRDTKDAVKVNKDRYNDALGSYADVAKGGVSEALTETMNNAVTRQMNRSLGEAMNQASGRGVLNSSVTNRAINQIGGNVADAFAKNYADMYGKELGAYGALAESAQKQQALDWQNFVAQYAPLLDFYKTVQHSADTNTQDTIVEQGK